MRLLICVVFLFPSIIYAQENFFHSHDLNGLSQSYSNIAYNDNYLYTAGVTICSSGECGTLSKYDHEGNLIFLNEINNIDIIIDYYLKK